MKLMQTILTKTILVILFISCTSNFISVHAQSTINVESAADSNMIRFVGVDGDMLVFDIQLESLPVKYSRVSILDENENLIFEERINATTYTRRYKIPRNDMDKVTFRIISGSLLRNQSFSINYRVEEKVEVKKVR